MFALSSSKAFLASGFDVNPTGWTIAKDRDMVKVLAAAIVAFGLPPAVFFVSGTVLSDPSVFGRFRGGIVGHLFWLAMNIASPCVGFGFLARPFQRWTELNRRTLVVVIGLAALYLIIYVPTMILGILGASICWSGCDL